METAAACGMNQGIFKHGTDVRIHGQVPSLMRGPSDLLMKIVESYNPLTVPSQREYKSMLPSWIFFQVSDGPICDHSESRFYLELGGFT